METEKIRKYFVNRKEAVSIQCRNCGRVRSFPISHLKDKNHLLKINCTCSETFEVALEFRQDYRQKSDISGYFRALSTPRARARHCIIADQSNGGLLLYVTEEVPIKTDDRVIVSYRPDSSFPREIEKTIRVRHYEPGHSLGGAFVETFPPRSARGLNRTMH